MRAMLLALMGLMFLVPAAAWGQDEDEPAAGVPTFTDGDGDGIKDDEDNCPTVPNPDQNADVCADADGDGVVDISDPCPSQYADTADGCPAPVPTPPPTSRPPDSWKEFKVNWEARKVPDSECQPGDCDGDGIPDELDAMYNMAEDMDGFQDDDGMPDLDNDQDGIPDTEDADPNQAEDYDGVEDNDGKPEGGPDNDFDGDGIADPEDQCPSVAPVPGKDTNNDGCPDRYTFSLESCADPTKRRVFQCLNADVSGKYRDGRPEWDTQCAKPAVEFAKNAGNMEAVSFSVVSYEDVVKLNRKNRGYKDLSKKYRCDDMKGLERDKCVTEGLLQERAKYIYEMVKPLLPDTFPAERLGVGGAAPDAPEGERGVGIVVKIGCGFLEEEPLRQFRSRSGIQPPAQRQRQVVTSNPEVHWHIRLGTALHHDSIGSQPDATIFGLPYVSFGFRGQGLMVDLGGGPGIVGSQDNGEYDASITGCWSVNARLVDTHGKVQGIWGDGFGWILLGVAGCHSAYSTAFDNALKWHSHRVGLNLGAILWESVDSPVEDGWEWVADVKLLGGWTFDHRKYLKQDDGTYVPNMAESFGTFTPVITTSFGYRW
ncbi:thrombospondin type 3 repeat-containing protein [Candidatus Nomurabacteria bacterium]|nr:thrombospondin type 3 repeat-containing protein [Candidatus Nomurabacteria bacterium]